MTAPDESFLLAHAAQQQAGTSPGKYPGCPTCEGHPWHGQQCRALVPSVGTTNVPCSCVSSFGGAA